MNARRAAATVGLTTGLLVAGPVSAAWADDPTGTASSAPAPAASSAPAATAAPAPGATTQPSSTPPTATPPTSTATTDPDASDDPTDGATDDPTDVTSDPTDAGTDDGTDAGDPDTDVGTNVDPRIFEAALPQGAVQKHVQQRAHRLPFTGAPIGALSVSGFGLLAVGTGSLLLGRRRQDETATGSGSEA